MSKQLSGAQKRKLKREREAIESESDESQFDGQGGANRFAVFGTPDFDKPETALTFARKYLMESLYQIGNDKGLTARERHRLIKETTMSLGATQPRREIEEAFKKLRDSRNQPTPEAKAAKADGVARPATARSYRSRGGRESVPGPLLGAQAGDDQGDPAVGGGSVGPPGSKVH